MMVLLSLAVNAAPEDDVLEALDEFYSAAKDEDIDRYTSVMEMEYYEALYEDDGFIQYIQQTFDDFETLSYEVIDPTLIINEDSAIVFYELKAEVELDGEKKKIDNSMVAVLYKYPEGWKLRWSILQTLFEHKLQYEALFDAAVEMTMAKTNLSIKEEMKQLGIDYDVVLEPNEKKGGWFKYIMIIIIIGGIVFYFKDNSRRKRFKKQVDKKAPIVKKHLKTAADKSKNMSKDAYGSTKKFYDEKAPIVKKHLKTVADKSKNMSKDAYGSTKKFYDEKAPIVKKKSVKFYKESKKKLKKK